MIMVGLLQALQGDVQWAKLLCGSPAQVRAEDGLREDLQELFRGELDVALSATQSVHPNHAGEARVRVRTEHD